MSAASAGNTGSSAGCRYNTGIYGWRIPALSRHQYSAGIHEYWHCLRPLSVSLFLFVCFWLLLCRSSLPWVRGQGGMGASEAGAQGVGGGGAYLLCCLPWSFGHRLFRDGAPFLLLIETPLTFGRSFCFFHILHIEAVCLSYPRPVSPSAVMATMYLLGQRSFSRYSLVYQTLPCMSHTSNFLISSSNASRSSLYISRSPIT